MTCFFPWFALENPRLAEHINISRRKKGLHDLIIEQPADTDRVQFLDRELPALIAAIIAGERRTLHDPPPIWPNTNLRA